MRNKNYLFIWSFLGLVLSFILPDFALGMKGYETYYTIILEWDAFFRGYISSLITMNICLSLLVLPFFLYSYYIRKKQIIGIEGRRIRNLVFFIFWLAPIFVAPLIYAIAFETSPMRTFEWGYALSAFFMVVLYVSYVKLNPLKEQDDLAKHLIDEDI